MIKVLLADDRQMVIDGLNSVLQKQKNIKVVAEANNGQQVLDILSTTEVDIAVLDIEMPEMNGIETTKIIREKYPNIKVLILSMYNKENFITEIIGVGASGYILKNKGKEELEEAIYQIYSGENYYGDQVYKTILESLGKPNKSKEPDPNDLITKREKEVLQHLANGLTVAKTAALLYIAPVTVEQHKRNMLDKTGCKNVTELATWGTSNGIVSHTQNTDPR